MLLRFIFAYPLRSSRSGRWLDGRTVILLCSVSSCSITQFGPNYSCWRGGLTFDARILWYKEKFTVNSVIARCPGSVFEKQAPNHHSSSSALDSCFEVFVVICCLCFLPNMVLFITAKHLQFHPLSNYTATHLTCKVKCWVWDVALRIERSDPSNLLGTFGKCLERYIWE